MAVDEDALKCFFKTYKFKSFSDVDTEFNNNFKTYKSNIFSTPHKYNDIFVGDLTVQEVSNSPGFLYLRNPFRDGALRELFRDAVMEWPGLPNPTNLNIESDCPDHIWQSSMVQKINGVQFKSTWLYRLRWTSLGFHYDWTKRSYRRGQRSAFPQNLQRIICAVTESLGWDKYEPQAGIVNYYHLNSSMCFHVDDAELNATAPLISISLGQPAVYLLGGSSRTDDSVQPIILRHGDLVVMSGASRMAFHAVPRVHHVPIGALRSTITGGVCWCGCSDDDAIRDTAVPKNCGSLECAFLWRYADCTRININARQVLMPGCSDLPLEND